MEKMCDKNKKTYNLIFAQKRAISWNVKKCHEIMDQFKSQGNSKSTRKEIAQKFGSKYNKVKTKLNEIGKIWLISLN